MNDTQRSPSNPNDLNPRNLTVLGVVVALLFLGGLWYLFVISVLVGVVLIILGFAFLVFLLLAIRKYRQKQI